MPLLARECARGLTGGRVSEELFAQAARSAAEESRPISDIRGSEGFRRERLDFLREGETQRDRGLVQSFLSLVKKGYVLGVSLTRSSFVSAEHFAENVAGLVPDIAIEDLPLPFAARFDGVDEPLDAWTFWTPFHEELTPSSHAQWHLDLEAGTLRQDGNFYQGSASDCTPQCLGTIAHTWTTDWSDYRAEVEVVSDDNDAYGLLFYYQDHDHYYRFSVDRQRSYALLARKETGTAVVELAKAVGVAPPAAGIPVELAVEVETGPTSTTVVATIDGVEVLTFEDDSAERLQQGGVGLYTWGNQGTAFDDVKVDVLTR